MRNIQRLITDIKENLDGGLRDRFMIGYLYSAHYRYYWDQEVDLAKFNIAPYEADAFPSSMSIQDIDAIKNTDDPAMRKKFVNSYANAIKYVDYLFATLKDFLVKNGLYDDSLIIFMADHGENLYDNGYLQHAGPGYESLTNIPLYIKPPRSRIMTQPPNATTIRTIDVFPTILDMLGVQSARHDLLTDPEVITGRSVYGQQPEAACSITSTPNGYNRYVDQIMLRSNNAKMFLEFSNKMIEHSAQVTPMDSDGFRINRITDLNDVEHNFASQSELNTFINNNFKSCFDEMLHDGFLAR